MVNTYGKIHRPWYALKDLYKGRKLLRLFIIIIAIVLAVYVSHRSLHKPPTTDDKKPDTGQVDNQSFMVSLFSRASAS